MYERAGERMIKRVGPYDRAADQMVEGVGPYDRASRSDGRRRQMIELSIRPSVTTGHKITLLFWTFRGHRPYNRRLKRPVSHQQRADRLPSTGLKTRAKRAKPAGLGYAPDEGASASFALSERRL